MKVVLIHEDNHGLLGVAKDYESALYFLLQEAWLTRATEVWNEEKETFIPLRDMNICFGDIKKWDIDKFNEFFEGIFYLDVDNVWGM